MTKCNPGKMISFFCDNFSTVVPFHEPFTSTTCCTNKNQTAKATGYGKPLNFKKVVKKFSYEELTTRELAPPSL